MTLAGITMLGLGLAAFLLDLYRANITNSTILAFLSLVSLRFMPRFVARINFRGIGHGACCLWNMGTQPGVSPSVPEAGAQGD